MITKLTIPNTLLLFTLLTLMCLPVKSQENETQGKQIEFDANSMEVDVDIAPDAKRLLGDVVFRHEGALMYCDSAYFYSERNALDAFSNVYVNQGDTLHLYCDFLKYNGNNKLANARREVKLVKDSTTLLSDSLDYNMNTNIGYYENRGKILNGNNTLYSIKGYYYVNKDVFFFKDSVEIHTPDYTIYSDTLQYHTKTKVSNFFGPTRIIGDSNFIYCELGWYDNLNNQGQVSKNSYLINKDHIMWGDSIYYDRNIGIAQAFQNVVLLDTTNELILMGHYGIHYEHQQNSMMTDSAVFIQIDGADSLYLHADTLRSISDTLIEKYTKDSTLFKGEEIIFRNYSKYNFLKTALYDEYSGIDPMPDIDSILESNYNIDLLKEKDTLIVYDSILLKDTVLSCDSLKPVKIIKAYHKVKFYRIDVQGKCDSLLYTTWDSVFHLFKEPILWSKENQMTADSMKLFTGYGRADSIKLKGNAFIASEEDAVHFNQIKGKIMTGYFQKNDLVKVKVKGNGETIYFPKDEGDIMGVNKAQSTDLIIHRKNQEISKIVFIVQPDASFLPIEETKAEELILKGFAWHDNFRPYSKHDIFIWDRFKKDGTEEQDDKEEKEDKEKKNSTEINKKSATDKQPAEKVTPKPINKTNVTPNTK